MRRLFWFCLGVATTLVATSWMKKKATEMAEKMTAENIARSVGAHAVSTARRVGDFVTTAWKTARSSSGETVIQTPKP